MSYSEVLLVKQKDITSKVNIKNLVTKNVDQSKLKAKINKVSQRQDGSVLICCEDKESKQKLITSINETIGDTVDVEIDPKKTKIPKKIEFIIDIQGDKLNDEEMIETIIHHNDIQISGQNFKLGILKRIPVHQNKSELVIIQIDDDIHITILCLQKKQKSN
jgi:hypothetical protein